MSQRQCHSNLVVAAPDCKPGRSWRLWRGEGAPLLPACPVPAGQDDWNVWKAKTAYCLKAGGLAVQVRRRATHAVSNLCLAMLRNVSWCA